MSSPVQYVSKSTMLPSVDQPLNSFPSGAITSISDKGVIFSPCAYSSSYILISPAYRSDILPSPASHVTVNNAGMSSASQAAPSPSPAEISITVTSPMSGSSSLFSSRTSEEFPAGFSSRFSSRFPEAFSAPSGIISSRYNSSSAAIKLIGMPESTSVPAITIDTSLYFRFLMMSALPLIPLISKVRSPKPLL